MLPQGIVRGSQARQWAAPSRKIGCLSEAGRKRVFCAAEQITRNGFTAFESTDGKTLYYTLSSIGSEGIYSKRLPDGEGKRLVNEAVAARGYAVFSDGIFYMHGIDRSRLERTLR
jgi:hypothetical protein